MVVSILGSMKIGLTPDHLPACDLLTDLLARRCDAATTAIPREHADRVSDLRFTPSDPARHNTELGNSHDKEPATGPATFYSVGAVLAVREAGSTTIRAQPF
jgi:hypothetical protein